MNFFCGRNCASDINTGFYGRSCKKIFRKEINYATHEKKRKHVKWMDKRVIVKLRRMEKDNTGRRKKTKPLRHTHTRSEGSKTLNSEKRGGREGILIYRNEMKEDDDAPPNERKEDEEETPNLE